MFGIEKETGHVKLVKPIDKDMAGHYRLQIAVQDNGLPPHTILTYIGITITEVHLCLGVEQYICNETW